MVNEDVPDLYDDGLANDIVDVSKESLEVHDQGNTENPNCDIQSVFKDLFGDDSDYDNNDNGGDMDEDAILNTHVDNDENYGPDIIENGYEHQAIRLINGDVNLDNTHPPTTGMSFPNGNELAAYIYLYAYKSGFVWTIKASDVKERYQEKGVKRNGTGDQEVRFGMLKRLRVACHKAAKSNEPSCKGCPVLIDARIPKRSGNEFMVFTVCKLEHEKHTVDPANSHHMVNYRFMGDYFKRRALMNDASGISIAKNFNTLVNEVGGHENLPFTRRDLRNAINLERRRGKIKGDAAALERRFAKMKAEDPNFYYAIETGEDNTLLNVFWSDARCREMCKVFGDVVSYDSTFLCNKYKMPFTPFVGVNHHGSTVVFAAALISYEDAPSFSWVFNKWLDCMGVAPKVILTDQCKGIGKVVEDVFTGTHHRLCIWHMMRNGERHLGAHTKFQAIKAELLRVVHDSLDEDEFEQAWFNMVDKYELHRNN